MKRIQLDQLEGFLFVSPYTVCSARVNRFVNGLPVYTMCKRAADFHPLSPALWRFHLHEPVAAGRLRRRHGDRPPTQRGR